MNTGIEGHTELPWDVVPSCEHHGPYIVSDYGSTIADLYTMSDPSSLSVRNGGTSKPIPFMAEMADANAAFIVQAVNSHDDLVAALRDAREFVQMNVDELLASCCITGPDGKPDRSTIDHMDKVAIDDAEGCLAKIDAALAKASAS